MKTSMSWRVAVVVLIGLFFVSAFGTIPYSAAQMSGPTPAETQKLIAQAQADLDAARAQYLATHNHMMGMDKMPMTANEKQMLSMMEAMNTTMKQLIDTEQLLLQVLKSGGANK